jgi:hypothetical protein
MTQIEDRQEAATSLATEAGLGHATVDALGGDRGLPADRIDETPEDGAARRLIDALPSDIGNDKGDLEGMTAPTSVAPVEPPAAIGPESPADAPLLDGDLEQGIADIFASLHTATVSDARPDAVHEDDDEHSLDNANPAGFSFGELDDATFDVEAVDTTTFRLLGELDRLWHRAA